MPVDVLDVEFVQHVLKYRPKSSTATLARSVGQLERSLLREIAEHDKTRRRLEARERELERIRSNNYSERVKGYMDQ